MRSMFDKLVFDPSLVSALCSIFNGINLSKRFLQSRPLFHPKNQHFAGLQKGVLLLKNIHLHA